MTGTIIISGPGVERSYNGNATTLTALSAAQGFATSAKPGSTFYVRDRDGSTVYYVERHEDATVTFIVEQADVR